MSAKSHFRGMNGNWSRWGDSPFFHNHILKPRSLCQKYKLLVTVNEVNHTLTSIVLTGIMFVSLQM